MWEPASTDAPAVASRDHVDVWLVETPSVRASVDVAVLSEGERARAARFRFERHRDAFVAAHWALRTVLACYLDTNAAALRFESGDHGKPFLAQPSSDLRFNLSHSHEVAIVAVTSGREVGCDVEWISERVPVDALAARFFSPPEQAEIEALDPAARRLAFFSCWSRKEAFIKARGEGLSLPLNGFDVNVTGEARLVATRPDPDEAQRWWMAALPCSPEYAGAVCASRSKGEPSPSVRRRRLVPAATA